MININLKFSVDPLEKHEWVDWASHTSLILGNPHTAFRFFRKILDDNNLYEYIVYYPLLNQISILQNAYFKDAHSIIDVMISHCVYCIVPDLNVAIYFNIRDDITVISTPDIFSTELLDLTDRHFAKHLAAGCVGFGDAGIQYGIDLVRDFFDNNRTNSFLKDFASRV